MEHWTVRGPRGERQVEAESWFAALGAVTDPTIGGSGGWRFDADDPFDVRVFDMEGALLYEVARREPTLADLDADPGDEPSVSETVAGMLAEGGDSLFYAESSEAAANATLEMLARHMPAESSAVIMVEGEGDEACLRFIAAQGPRADDVRALRLPVDEGAAGWCIETGSTVLVRDVESDPRASRRVDIAIGYQTRSLLAVPMRTDDGTCFGCVELVNPEAPFAAWEVDTARAVARVLAGVLVFHGATDRG